MVVGKGMIASRFADYNDNDRFVIFASGVSNSQISNKDEFELEKKLLSHTAEHHKDKIFVYFSTCSIYDPEKKSTPYVVHKLEMERLIMEQHPMPVIFRVSNPIGLTKNRHTVFNYFVDHIQQDIPFFIWKNAERNIIDIDDMFVICDAFLKKPYEKRNPVNIANPINYPIMSIVETIEHHFSKKGIYTLIQGESSPIINTEDIMPIIKDKGIEFNKDYQNKIIKKYFTGE
jgi:nucleoside-diphosphate-sugar epimerase